MVSAGPNPAVNRTRRFMASIWRAYSRRAGYLTRYAASPSRTIRGMNESMSLFERLKYSLCLAAVSGAIIGLLVSLATADFIRLLPIAVFEMMFSPLYLVALYVVAFVTAPWVADRLPITRGPT